jgi:hypothetical protein
MERGKDVSGYNENTFFLAGLIEFKKDLKIYQ